MKRILTLIVCAVALNIPCKSQTLEIALFQETGYEEATKASLLNYSSEHGSNFTFSERVLAQGCDSISTLLEEMDVAIFLGGSKPTHCNWIDLVPKLHSFVNEGGTLIFQGPLDPLSFGPSTFLFDEGQWNLYFGEAPWFGILEDNQFWCCGLAVQNANCEDSGTLFGTAHADHPIFDNVYDYSADSAQCHMMINEPSWFSLTEPDLNDPRFFSIYEYGTAINSSTTTLTNLQAVGSSTQMIFGKSIGLGEVLFFGENNPLPNPHQGSQNLLGNLITHFAVTPGCMHQAACNYDASADVDDGSCTELDACGDCGGEGVSGCTAPVACNYNPVASCDDGSCIYPPVIDLNDDIETCEESVMLDAGPGFGSYLWSTGDTTQTMGVSESGSYDLTVAS